MKRFTLLCAAVFCCFAAFAPIASAQSGGSPPGALCEDSVYAQPQDNPPPTVGSAYSGAFYYDVKEKEMSAVALARLKRLERLKIDVSAFGGYNTHREKPIAGFAATREFAPDRDLSLFLGAAVVVQGDSPISWGPIAGLSIRF